MQELITLLLAALINGDHMNTINGIGLVICLAGIVLHVSLKAYYLCECMLLSDYSVALLEIYRVFTVVLC